MTGFKEYDDFDAFGLAELIKKGEVSAIELLEESIARTEKVNPRINAVIRPMFDIARARAKQVVEGPFAGVPFFVERPDCQLCGCRNELRKPFLQRFCTRRGF